ncbi:MAG: magnesium transporter MgtE [Geobacillus sp.]|nr:MAG: magnesium transporter MgtE [Geobacillus sp.]
MAANQEMEREEKGSKLQWFLFIIVIPTLFATALALVIMEIAGINVLDTVKKHSKDIPIVSQYIDVQKAKSEWEKEAEKAIEQKNKVIAKQQKEIKKLENELATKQQEINDLTTEVNSLREELSAAETTAGEANAQAQTPTMKDVARMYETMSEKNAAMILAKMPESEALAILSLLDSDKAAAILEKMPPDNAAKYTSMLAQRAKENSPIEEAAR